MYITTPRRKNGSRVVRLVESFWKDGKVKNRIVKTIGQSKDPEVIKRYKKIACELLERHKKGIISLPGISEKLQVDLLRFVGEDRYNNGFEDILGASYEELGFSSLIKSGKDRVLLNEILRSMVLMRVFSPSSKLRSCGLLEEHFNKKVSLKQVLNMMDHVSRGEKQIKKELFGSVLRGREKLELLLFDVTTLYFESIRSDDLREFGYSKDGKFNEVQLVLGVLSDEEGLPLSYEVFRGGTGEAKTISDVLKSFVRSYGVKSLRVVADRAMFSDNNFSFLEGLEEELGIRAEYVLSCPLKRLPKQIKDKILDFKRKELKKRESDSLSSSSSSSSSSKACSYYEFSYKGRRMIVSYSEELRSRDESKRQKILDKLSSLAKGGRVPASRLVKNTGVRRYLKTFRGCVEIDRDKIFQDSLWDGLYGICSNKKNETPKQLLESYRCLWKIEELFRINKHTLRMRPIYHRLAKRIRAHILICFLAYTILRRTEIVLKKAGLFFSPQELIDILKNVEIFIIQDKIKGPAFSYCIPRTLSKEAQKIYSVFNKEYAKKPYKMEKT